MRMSCRNIGVLLLTVLLGIGSSMADVFERPLSAKNRPELEKSLAKVMDYQVASGDFKQTKSIQKLNREFVSTGTFRISKKAGIIWKMQTPVFSELALNDGGVFERDSSGQSQMLLPKDNPIFTDLSRNIQSFFSGKISELESKFQIFYEKKSCGFVMGLVPREGMVRMVVDNVIIEACKNIDKVIITDGGKTPVMLEFLNYKTVGKTMPKRETSAP